MTINSVTEYSLATYCLGVFRQVGQPFQNSVSVSEKWGQSSMIGLWWWLYEKKSRAYYSALTDIYVFQNSMFVLNCIIIWSPMSTILFHELDCTFLKGDDKKLSCI